MLHRVSASRLGAWAVALLLLGAGATACAHVRPDGNYQPAPFTVLRIESAHGFYYPDAERIRAEPLALGRRIAEGHRVEADGELL